MSTNSKEILLNEHVVGNPSTMYELSQEEIPETKTNEDGSQIESKNREVGQT